MSYVAAVERYDRMVYRFCGRSGLQLPALALGLWHNFGDWANNYGPPCGSAERNFGRLFREDFAPYRDELIISTKAGWDMWPGPYGQGGGSRKYLIASLDQSLGRTGLDCVDIFYSHRFDPDSPLEETIGALATAVQQGKALYAGISSYSPRVTSAVIGASRPEQVIENVGALGNLEFTPEQLAAIEGYAQEGGVNLWERPSHDERP